MSVKKITVLAFLLIALLFVSLANASEEQQTQLGQFSSWSILKGESGGQTYCYAFSEPYQSILTTAITTKSPYLLVVYKGHDQITFSAHLGFEVFKKSQIMLEVNDSDILLDTSPPYSGKTYSSAQDIQLLNDIVETSNDITVKSFTKYGEYVADYYKVDGILKALRFMEKKCN